MKSYSFNYPLPVACIILTKITNITAKIRINKYQKLFLKILTGSFKDKLLKNLTINITKATIVAKRKIKPNIEIIHLSHPNKLSKYATPMIINKKAEANIQKTENNCRKLFSHFFIYSQTKTPIKTFLKILAQRILLLEILTKNTLYILLS